MANGEVLVSGGITANGGGAIGDAEIYNPTTGSWTYTTSMIKPRVGFTMTLLPSGKVLVAGGRSAQYIYGSAELYDPTTGTWAYTTSMAETREVATAVLLANGQVCIVSGINGVSNFLWGVELYNPATAQWTTTAYINVGRSSETTTLLSDGKVLVAGGGQSITSSFADSQLFDPGLGFTGDSQPHINIAEFTANDRLRLAGSLFQSISQASDGTTQDSSSNDPVVQLRALGNDQVIFLFTDPRRGWSDTSYSSLPPTGFVPGPALATVFTNGIPSDAKYLVVAPVP